MKQLEIKLPSQAISKQLKSFDLAKAMSYFRGIPDIAKKIKAFLAGEKNSGFEGSLMITAAHALGMLTAVDAAKIMTASGGNSGHIAYVSLKHGLRFKFNEPENEADVKKLEKDFPEGKPFKIGEGRSCLVDKVII